MTFYFDKQKVLTSNDLNKNSYIALFDLIRLEHKVITSWSLIAILTYKVYPVMKKNNQMISFIFLPWNSKDKKWLITNRLAF